MQKKRLIKRLAASVVAVCCLVGALLGRQGLVSAETEIAASAYVLIEAETGMVLLESNAEAVFSCGVMAKLMTAYLAAQKLEDGTWTTETTLIAGTEVSGMQGAVIWLVPGETMTVSDLLKGLLVGNAGDAAAVLAVAISGDVAHFVMDMNACAFDLGLRHTCFTTPQGTNEDGQYTTAYDLALLCRALAQKTALTPYFQIWRDFLRDGETELVNENVWARTDENTIGFKACHTETDGWHLAAGDTQNGMTCIAVVLGCETDDDRYTLARSLLRRGFSGWKVVQTGFSTEFLYPLAVRGGVAPSVLVESSTLHALAIPKNSADIETVLVMPNYVLAPVKKGQSLGTVAFYQGDTLYYETTVVAANAVEKRNFWDALAHVIVKLHEL